MHSSAIRRAAAEATRMSAIVATAIAPQSDEMRADDGSVRR
jgi:hypothetical protein